ncbi:MAG: DNA polymerase III subunit delta [Candidatus Pacebacteria bacterium]|nr:DNA polymerase III subunit delta [Candidatus Paceibacterota bacterium]
MIIFLYGKDTFRSKKKMEEIVASYKKIHKNGISFSHFSDQNLNFQNFKNEIEINSMFQEKKLAVLENVFSNVNFKEKFLEEQNNFLKSENIILIYERKEIDKRDSLFKFLQKNSKAQEFELLEGEKLKNWAKKEISNYKVEIEANAFEFLLDSVGSDLWQMENEIKKLASYAKGKKIKKEDTEILIKPKIENDIFKTIDSLVEKKKDKALSLLHRHLEKGDSPLYLLSMVAMQFRNILEMKDLMEKNTPFYEIVKKSGLHPFVAKKSYWQAQRFNSPELKKIYQKILKADLSIKTGKIEPETALDLLISGI